MRPVILVDCDGVTCNFIERYLEIANHVLDRKHIEQDIDQWDLAACLQLTGDEEDAVDRRVRELGVARTLTPYPGAVEGVKRLMGLGEVYFVTSPYRGCPTWAHDRGLWLDEHLGPDSHRLAIFCKRKHLIRGDVLVDDKPENITEWVKHNPSGVGVLWAQPYNAGCVDTWNVVRTDSWEDVGEIATDVARRNRLRGA